MGCGEVGFENLELHTICEFRNIRVLRFANGRVQNRDTDSANIYKWVRFLRFTFGLMYD